MGWLILSVLLWGIVHSILATYGVKKWISGVLGNTGSRFYRLSYNLFSVISLVPSLWIWWRTPNYTLYQIAAPWVYLTTLGQLLAVIALIVGVIQTDVFAFTGLRQLFEGEQADDRLVTRGLYHWVRHPLYTAGLVFMWLSPVVSRNTLVFFITATLYLIIGAHFEECKLIRQFGSVYINYKANTPMLIPGLFFRRKKNFIYSSND